MGNRSRLDWVRQEPHPPKVLFDPAIGKFISEDPKGFDGGDVNLMRYVGNNPTNLTDPFGLDATSQSNRPVNESARQQAFELFVAYQETKFLVGAEFLNEQILAQVDSAPREVQIYFNSALGDPIDDADAELVGGITNRFSDGSPDTTRLKLDIEEDFYGAYNSFVRERDKNERDQARQGLRDAGVGADKLNIDRVQEGIANDRENKLRDLSSKLERQDDLQFASNLRFALGIVALVTAFVPGLQPLSTVITVGLFADAARRATNDECDDDPSALELIVPVGTAGLSVGLKLAKNATKVAKTTQPIINGERKIVETINKGSGSGRTADDVLREMNEADTAADAALSEARKKFLSNEQAKRDAFAAENQKKLTELQNRGFKDAADELQFKIDQKQAIQQLKAEEDAAQVALELQKAQALKNSIEKAVPIPNVVDDLASTGQAATKQLSSRQRISQNDLKNANPEIKALAEQEAAKKAAKGLKGEQQLTFVKLEFRGKLTDTLRQRVNEATGGKLGPKNNPIIDDAGPTTPIPTLEGF